MIATRAFRFSRFTGPLLSGLLVALLVSLEHPAAAQDSSYTSHPRLLFSAADVESLRAKLQDGGEDDRAYTAIRSWAGTILSTAPTYLLGSWEGLHTVGPLGLVSWIDPTGGPFAAKVRDVILYLVRNRDVDNNEFASALRLHAMALGYDMAFAGATAAERAEVQREMRAYLDYMPLHFNYYAGAYNPYCGNHAMTVGAAIGLATIALWDDVTPAGRDSLAAVRAFGDALVAKTLGDVLGRDGAYGEGVLYAGWIVRVAAPYFEARRRFDGFDFAADPRLHRMIDWLCYELTADGSGRTNALNDSPWSSRPLALHNTVLEWAQMRWSSPLARYLHDHVVGTYGYDYGIFADRLATALWAQPIAAANPVTLLPHGRLFADRGLYYYRSGWKTEWTGTEVVFSLFSGKFWGGHAQEDQNQFTLAGYGGRWAVDCGAASASAPTPKQTEAHNLVLVDGHGQHNAGNSIGTDGRMAAVLLSESADYLRADAGAAYATYSPFNAPGVPFPTSDWSWGYDGGNPLERASRLCLVVKDGAEPPYVVIADDVKRDAAAHTYDWLLHTATLNGIDLTSVPVRLSTVQAACDVFFAHPTGLDLSWATFQHGGDDPPTHRIVARVQDVEPRFVVALVPRPNGVPAPTYTATSDSIATTLVLDWGSVRDLTVVDPHGLPVSGEVETDGRMAFVRRDSSGVRRWLLGEGARLACSGVEMLSLSAAASASYAGDTLHLSRDDVVFDAWAPEALVVVGPSGPMAFGRDGQRLRNSTSAVATAPPPSALVLDIASRHPGAGDLRLRLALPRPARVRLRIFDARGRVVATLVDAERRTGEHFFVWPERDRRGRRVAPGVYVAVAEANGMRAVRKLVVVPGSG